MAATAKLRFARIQPTKVRQVARLVTGKPVAEAESILSLLPNRAAGVLNKVLQSATANAENNHEMNRDDLYVRAVTADQGPTFGRLKPRARGRADVFRRQLAHITVVVAERGEE